VTNEIPGAGNAGDRTAFVGKRDPSTSKLEAAPSPRPGRNVVERGSRVGVQFGDWMVLSADASTRHPACRCRCPSQSNGSARDLGGSR
jgi:hypothetical protein